MKDKADIKPSRCGWCDKWINAFCCDEHRDAFERRHMRPALRRGDALFVSEVPTAERPQITADDLETMRKATEGLQRIVKYFEALDQ